jgi:hypothetical protein
LFTLTIHSNRRFLTVAGILSLVILAGGCAMWDRDRWDLSRYRDERALDIDQRLSSEEAVVKSPF